TPAAIAQLDRTIAQCPEQVEAYLAAGRVLIEARQFDRAETYLLKAQKLAPHSDTILLNLALLRLRQKRTSDAIPLLQSAIRLNPKRADSYTLLGNAYITLKQPALAAQAYETAIQLGSDE